MTEEAFDAPAELRRLITEGGITEDELGSVTGIGQEALRSFVFYGQSETGLTTIPLAFSAEESTRLSILAAQLVDGMNIPDDDRLKGILEVLATTFHLTSQKIAKLARLDAKDVDDALSDPTSTIGRQEVRTRTQGLLSPQRSQPRWQQVT